MRILNKITYKKTYLHKSTLTSGNAYRITLNYKNNTIWFIYNDNIYNKSTLNDFIYCLLLDSQAYEINKGNVFEFMREFGYNDTHEAKRIYNACEKQSERLHKLFTNEEIQQLNKHFENY